MWLRTAHRAPSRITGNITRNTLGTRYLDPKRSFSTPAGSFRTSPRVHLLSHSSGRFWRKALSTQPALRFVSTNRLQFLTQRATYSSKPKSNKPQTIAEKAAEQGYTVTHVDPNHPLIPEFKALDDQSHSNPPVIFIPPDVSDADIERMIASKSNVSEDTAALSKENPKLVAILQKWKEGYHLDSMQQMIDLTTETTKQYGQWHEKTVVLIELLAMMYRDTAKLDEANTLFEKVVKWRESKNDTSIDAAMTYKNFAPILIFRGDMELAEKYLIKALQIFKEHHPQHKKFDEDMVISLQEEELDTLTSLLHLYERQQKPEPMENLLIDAIELNTKLYGETHLMNATYLTSLAAVTLFRHQDYEEAKRLLDRALELHENLGTDPDDEGYQWAKMLMEQIEDVQKQKDEETQKDETQKAGPKKSAK